MITGQVEIAAPSYHKVIQCGPAQERHVFKQHGFLHLRQFLRFVPGKRYLLAVLPESEVHSFLKGYLDDISPYAYNSPPLLYLDPFLHIFSSYSISRVGDVGKKMQENYNHFCCSWSQGPSQSLLCSSSPNHFRVTLLFLVAYLVEWPRSLFLRHALWSSYLSHTGFAALAHLPSQLVKEVPKGT